MKNIFHFSSPQSRQNPCQNQCVFSSARSRVLTYEYTTVFHSVTADFFTLGEVAWVLIEYARVSTADQNVDLGFKSLHD
jgi:hypothetical protein